MRKTCGLNYGYFRIKCKNHGAEVFINESEWRREASVGKEAA